MHQPEGFQQFDPNGKKMVCKLNRDLDGIKQAPRAWNSCVTEWLEIYGFAQSRVDPGIYTTIYKGHLYVLAIHVDDCLLIGRSASFIVEIKKDFSLEFKIEDLGPVSDAILSVTENFGHCVYVNDNTLLIYLIFSTWPIICR
jgi:hypothetical protein